ncbi:MAG: hypothetical protein FJ386_11845 [Verrucomicrobia bacterium]|nr:hypothetical protein [Verrucomicrobiota bacterium]
MAGKLKFPIVLACGIARFDALREQFAALVGTKGVQLSDAGHYFRFIKSRLEERGFTTRHTQVSFAARVDVRANELAAQVGAIRRELNAGQVHIIAHSMGGLDARRMIVDITGAAATVASLTTIGTPHWGSPVADAMLARGFESVVDKLQPFITLEGVHDLATEACRRFNERAEPVEAANAVHYAAWSGAQVRDQTFFPLLKSWDVTHAAEGDNDGLVSVKSQRWQPALHAPGVTKPVHQRSFPFPADHLNQIGWWMPPAAEFAFPTLARCRAWRARAQEIEAAVQQVYLGVADELEVMESFGRLR